MNKAEVVMNAARAMEDGLNKLSAVQSLIAGEAMNDESIDSLREFKCVQDFLDMPFNDPREGDLKKVFAGAISAASEMGILPFEMDYDSAESLASAVDDGLTRIKFAYQLGTGKLNVEQVADMLVDHYAAKAIALADYAIDYGANAIATAVTSALAFVYPPAAALDPVIRTGMAIVGNKAKTFVRKAALYVTSAAKKVVHGAIRTVKSIGKSMASKVKSWLFC